MAGVPIWFGRIDAACTLLFAKAMVELRSGNDTFAPLLGQPAGDESECL
ncbi:hypothetical protein PY365_02135 [Roseiarcaceae bacterium H3SJ34-1]|nr:hypothetical protein [Roseiarcaceae bacterium H3SJ34-1]